MSVASRNPFDILSDEVPVAPSQSKKDEPAAQPTRGGAKSRTAGPASRGGRYYQRGGKPPGKDSTGEDPVSENQQRKAEGAREGGRGRGRGRGGPRGGARGRTYDRHSATGKTDSDKKLHQGWGGDDGETERKAEAAAGVDAAAETTNDWGAPPAANDWGGAPAEGVADAWGPSPDAPAPAPEGGEKTEGRPRREREPEEEDNTLTLDQYLAQQKEKDSIIPKLESTRKANDGDEEVWSGAVALSKNEEEDAYYVGKTKNTPKARAKKEEKVYLEIDARFERPDRGGRGRGRGDRGGDRGRGTRGRGGRGGARQPNGLDVDNQVEFPSLG